MRCGHRTGDFSTYKREEFSPYKREEFCPNRPYKREEFSSLHVVKSK